MKQTRVGGNSLWGWSKAMLQSKLNVACLWHRLHGFCIHFPGSASFPTLTPNVRNRLSVQAHDSAPSHPVLSHGHSVPTNIFFSFSFFFFLFSSSSFFSFFFFSFLFSFSSSFFFFGHACSLWKFQGQGQNTSHRSNRSHCCDNTGSLTCCNTRELHHSFVLSN